MTHTVTAVILSLIWVTLTTAPSSSAWETSELIIYLWRAPKVADLDAKAKALADAGYAVEKLDKRTGEWMTISASSFVGFTFVIGPAEGELFKIKTKIKQ